jgi:hypothetical protein
MAHNTATGAHLQGGLERPSHYNINGNPRPIQSAGALPDWGDPEQQGAKAGTGQMRASAVIGRMRAPAEGDGLGGSGHSVDLLPNTASLLGVVGLRQERLGPLRHGTSGDLVGRQHQPCPGGVHVGGTAARGTGR